LHTEMLWAGVSFSALGGRTGALLQNAAEHNLRLRRIVACPGGFTACCRAREYLALARMARHYRVHLHIRRRRGAYFSLKATLHRMGLWAGLAVFGLLILYSQNLIWSISYVDLTIGQQARVAAVLRQYGMEQGAYVHPDMLTLGETALVEGGEFGWASLNFEDGRLTVEAAPAEAVPEIEQLRYTDILAKTAATVVSLDVQRGTAAVKVGDPVGGGQVLIAVNRTDRKGNPVAGCAAGNVQGRFSWGFEAEQPLCYDALVPEGRILSSRQLLCMSHTFSLPGKEPTEPDAHTMTKQRHGVLSIFGLTMPVAYHETEYIPYETQVVTITESLALAKARLAAKRALRQEWPDAKVLAQREDYETEDDALQYSLLLTIQANICDTGDA
jgi:similar to stage IV sporulation protein